MEEGISFSHIEKLGHKILEIRERALFNIVSKLETGILFDNDLARNKELLTKLFQWFLLEPCTQKQVVFSLLKHILKSKSGRTLINHYGKSTLKEQICRIRSYLESKYYSVLDELCDIVDKEEEEPEVPPLKTDVPLSYRTDSYCSLSSPIVGTTATAIEGYIQKESFREDQGVLQRPETLSTKNLDTDKSFIIDNANKSRSSILPNLYLNWQSLIEPDRHILQSVENSLKDPPQSSALLSSCEFFTNILLHDFPAEIFLQRPAIVLELYHLLTCGSVRVTNAILAALCSLTKLLQTRIHYSNDISLRNFKSNLLCRSDSDPNSPRLSEINTEPMQMSENFEKLEDILKIKKNQLSFPKYCFTTLAKVFEFLCTRQDEFGDEKPKQNKVGINFCLVLLEEVRHLLCLSIEKGIWDSERTEETLVVLIGLNELLVQYGEALEFFRVKFTVTETSPIFRIIYLYLIHNTAALLQHFVPLSKAGTVLPRNLKCALSSSLLDVTLGKLYPNVQTTILNYVKSFSSHSELESVTKYQQVSEVCNGMSAMVVFLKQHKYLSMQESLKIAKEALPSIEFLMNFDFLKIFVDMCSFNFRQIADDCKLTGLVEEIVLNLLSHNVTQIKEEMYRLCHGTIITHIGPEARIDPTGSQILFLLSPKIIINIATFGMTSENLKITRYAEDIVLYVMKCRTLVCETVWNKIVQILIPSLPLVTCHCKKNSPIAKMIMSLLDPDRATENFIPPVVMLKCNAEFLFSKEVSLRDEAFSRLCWLLNSREGSRELLPKFNTMYDSALSNVFRLRILGDINKSRLTDHFYQPTSLCQVMEIMNSEGVEPVLKRSALNQVSVMMEDPLLHDIFLERNGVELVLAVMKSALTERDYRNYPDSVVPVMSILKNICLYHYDVREALAVDVEVFHFVLRGLFLFFTEERVRQDSGILLCLLIFKDFVRGTPSNASFSLPSLICRNLQLPFLCGTHWDVSDYTQPSLLDSVNSDRWCASSIRIQWNSEIFGGFEELIKWDILNYEGVQFGFSDELKLSASHLKMLKTSSIHFCITEYLVMIQNGTSHGAIIELIEDITTCIYLKKITNTDNERFLSHSWEQTFAKFLKSLPSCKDDVFLLQNVVQLLTLLAPFYTLAGKKCWITKILKDNTRYLLDMLSTDGSRDDDKTVAQELLKLVTVCACREQHYLDFYTLNTTTSDFEPWTHVIKVIADILKFNDTQRFYNLAYLDFLLLCLVHLTATLGWSSVNPKETTRDLISSLRELIGAFHCGKGSSADVSVMGLSITRHVLLILNNAAAELRNSKTKLWERHFLGDDAGKFMRNFLALWTSRDVIVRAGALQLFSGLAVSPRAAVEIVGDGGSILKLAFTALVDDREANIVREYAAQLISNLAARMPPVSSSKPVSLNSTLVLKENYTNEVLSLIEEFDIYGTLEMTLNNLFTMTIPDNAWIPRSSQDTSSGTSQTVSSEDASSIATPGLVKAFGLFLYDTLNLAPDDIANRLHERGLVKLLFRSLCNPSMSVSNPCELSLYCDVLEMDTVVCSVLIKLAQISMACVGTILHTYDCFNVLISLLNYKNFQTDLPELMYLRNNLWAKIFDLLTILIENASRDEGNKTVEVLSIFYETMFQSNHQPFMETVCESVSCIGSTGLQNSSLKFLTSLLKTDFYQISVKSDVNSDASDKSLRNVLDSVRTSRTSVISPTIDQTASKSSEKTRNRRVIVKNDRRKMNLLEEAYFGEVLPKLEEECLDSDGEISFLENNDDGLLTGVELCKILLHLYDVSNLRTNDALSKIKDNVTTALASLLCVSAEAKRHALKNGFLNKLMKQLRDKHIQLSLESVESFRKATDKKKICPVLNETNGLVTLLTNFMIDSEAVKLEAAKLNLADVVHKLWVWFLTQKNYLVDVLRLLSVYSAGCAIGCQSMTLTSSTAGSGPRKTPTNDSLLHALVTITTKETEQFTKIRDLTVLRTSFNVLCNCCSSLECRILIAKGSLLNSISHMHPSKTKRQKPWDSVESIWLDFLHTFTAYPEGQSAVAKTADVLELIMSLTSSPRPQNKLAALLVLRNIAFYQPNKTRLLGSEEFLNILQIKLANGTYEERNAVVTIVWALAANNQKGKKILKSAHLDALLDDTAKQCRLLKHDTSLNGVDLNRIDFVLNLLRSR